MSKDPYNLFIQILESIGSCYRNPDQMEVKNPKESHLIFGITRRFFHSVFFCLTVKIETLRKLN